MTTTTEAPAPSGSGVRTYDANGIDMAAVEDALAAAKRAGISVSFNDVWAIVKLYRASLASDASPASTSGSQDGCALRWEQDRDGDFTARTHAREYHVQSNGSGLWHGWSDGHDSRAFDTAAEALNYCLDIHLANDTSPRGEAVAWVQKEALAELAKHKDATATISSGLLKKPFGNPVALYAHPAPAPAPAEVVEKALAALVSAREQLEGYERDATGESYNDTQINAAIDELHALASPAPASETERSHG